MIDVLDCRHVVIDIETLGTAPSAVILSIAAVEVDGDGREEWLLDPERQPGRTVSASTVAWWMRQTQEARDRAFGGVGSLYGALQGLDDLISRGHPRPVMVWSRGSMDIAVLQHAYEHGHDGVPWDFWMVRDVRTIADLVGDPGFGVGEVKHTALGDAKRDARIVGAWLEHVRCQRGTVTA